jgi:glycosyltransferase involved in cell wall biosynthesis
MLFRGGRKVKIMYIANGNGLSDKVGGSLIRTINIAKRLEEKGCEIHFLTTIGGYKACKREGLMSVNYHILPASLLKRDETNTFDRFLSYIISTLASIFIIPRLPEVNVIYTDSDYLCDVIPAILFKKRYKDVKWVASIYHFIPHPSKRPGGLKLSNVLSYIGQQISLRIIMKEADRINTETDFLKNELVKKYRMFSDKIVVVQSGINQNIIDKASCYGKFYDACLLAALRRSKGIFDLVKAWKVVCEYKENAKLAIAGGGSAETIKELKNEIKKLNLENNIDLIGFLSEVEKYKLFKSSKLYVLPSYEEGIPITFYEAMYCGLPVVTYYLPTYEEIKDYIVSVPLGDVKKLAEEIIRVLEDENLARKLGDMGRKFAKEHTWDKVAECIISQIEKLKLK